MKPHEYAAARAMRGTQAEVAAMLGIDRVTIARRETGTRAISREAILAINSLPPKTPLLSLRATEKQKQPANRKKLHRLPR